MSYSTFNPLDYTDKLTDTEVQRLLTFKSTKRRQEYTATRILRSRIFGKKHIYYSEIGAPYIKDIPHFSISHSNHQVGIAVNEDYYIGLDLESYRSNILSLRDKFLSQHERDHIDIDSSLDITKIWSAKEALYKLAGRKKIIFSEELILSKLTDQKWNGKIINPNNEVFVKLDIFDRNNTIISINSEAVVKIDRNI
ncbi:MAG: 4'-phosphopantetheinyl transferase superfamily protein [Crocinitomicaceae bacterium]|nr:4'-phosphopantetheinyl transferase superfamily protein [Crocinitomicaceae bacterium]